MLEVKPFQETLHRSMCGPAALKMILDYYGVDKSEESLAKLCHTTKKLGTSAEGIKEAAEHLGFTVMIKDNSTFDDILTYLAQNTPVIVDWFSRGRTDYDASEVPDGHYSVVVGLDPQFIYLQDPETGGLRTLNWEDFETVWFDFKTHKIEKWSDLILRQIIVITK
jgi:ABC-type bacteriocin/lantibiotic exporter with double-glycine peptidase domain